MKQLMVTKPDKPLDYLIDKLSDPTGKLNNLFSKFRFLTLFFDSYSKTTFRRWPTRLRKKRICQETQRKIPNDYYFDRRPFEKRNHQKN